LRLRFERLNIRKRDENVKDQDQDQALYVGGQFKGKCRSCGKIGHKAANCKLKNGGNKFEQNRANENKIVKPNIFTCNYCGKPGHKYAESRKRIRDENENKSKLLNNHKKHNNNFQNDGANIATKANSDCDIVLIADDNLKIKVGGCPNCGDYGPIGTYCTECEDSEMIYDEFDLTSTMENDSSISENNNNNKENEGTYLNESRYYVAQATIWYMVKSFCRANFKDFTNRFERR
jgi:hypothetical protein